MSTEIAKNDFFLNFFYQTSLISKQYFFKYDDNRNCKKEKHFFLYYFQPTSLISIIINNIHAVFFMYAASSYNILFQLTNISFGRKTTEKHKNCLTFRKYWLTVL